MKEDAQVSTFVHFLFQELFATATRSACKNTSFKVQQWALSHEDDPVHTGPLCQFYTARGSWTENFEQFEWAEKNYLLQIVRFRYWKDFWDPRIKKIFERKLGKLKPLA